MKRCFVHPALCCFAGLLLATKGVTDTYTVTTTADTGAGSLRQAIADVNEHAGPDTIGFDIPETGSVFNHSCWFIEPLSNLPALTDDGTVIDGTTQTARRGDKNPDGPEVYLMGYQGRNGYPVTSGIHCVSSNNVIRGLIVSCFRETGITLAGGRAYNNRILGNFIGTSFGGQDTMNSPNNIGIMISNGARHNTVGGTSSGERNLVSGNVYAGMAIIDADSNRVIGNTIGTNILQNRSLQNGELGVWLLNASGNEIGGSLPDEGNVISGNGHWGVEIYDANSIGNRIAGNWIGIDSGGRWALPNLEGGVYIHNGARQNQIGPSNRIRFNGGIGVCVHMEDAKYNTITQNSISDNASEGILLLSGGNGEIHPPSVQWTADGIAGTAAPNATVEIFSDPASQGLTFEGFVTADGDGNFSWTGTPSGPFVTATATDPSGNTSPFSAAVGLSGADDARPESARMFTLSQNFPNPFNPSTAIRFSLKESCRLVLRIFDLRGHEVSKLADGKFGPGEHTVRFDASGLPSGIYVVRIRAGDFVAARKMVKVE